MHSQQKSLIRFLLVLILQFISNLKQIVTVTVSIHA